MILATFNKQDTLSLVDKLSFTVMSPIYVVSSSFRITKELINELATTFKLRTLNDVDKIIAGDSEFTVIGVPFVKIRGLTGHIIFNEIQNMNHESVKEFIENEENNNRLR